MNPRNLQQDPLNGPLNLSSNSSSSSVRGPLVRSHSIFDGMNQEFMSLKGFKLLSSQTALRIRFRDVGWFGGVKFSHLFF